MSKLEKIEKYVEHQKENKLLKLVHDKDQQVRLAAIEGLGKVGKDDGFNALITLIADENGTIRAASARALGELGNEHAVAHLVYRMEHETDQEVISAIKNAISTLHDKEE